MLYLRDGLTCVSSTGRRLGSVVASIIDARGDTLSVPYYALQGMKEDS